MDAADFQSHVDTFNSSYNDQWDHANSRQQRRAKAKSEIKIQRYWSKFVNHIFAVNDEMNGPKAPIIFFGDGKFGTGKGSRAGNYTDVLRNSIYSPRPI